MRAVNQARIGRAIAAVIVVMVTGCHTPLPKYDYAQEPDPTHGEITLGVGDTIAINVWENANLNTEATIRADGKITMPLIGDIRAVGETPTSLKALIRTQLQNFVKLQAGNEVTIAVRSWKSYRFTVQGEVGHSGVFTSDQYVTVSEALALAGGLTKFAKRSEVQLTRTDPKTGKPKHIPFDYDLIVSGKRPDMDIFVLPGDAIWVP
jgi:polysaccharide export outer membrane protein